MAIQGNYEVLSVLAGADLSAAQYKAIDVNGVIAASSEAAFGLLQNKPDAAGKDASLAWKGRLKGYAGAAIAIGGAVIVTTSGFMITATINANSGSGLVSTSVGKAMVAANSGDLFTFIGDFSTATNVASL